MTVEADRTGRRSIKAAEVVEQGGFTGAIGADYGIDQAFRHLETDASQSHDTAEALFQIVDCDQRGDGRRAMNSALSSWQTGEGWFWLAKIMAHR